MFLITNKEFLNFGENKVILVNGKNKNDTFNLHHNVLLKNTTTFEQYWSKIKDILNERYEEGYAIEGIPMVEIITWNMDLYANKKIKITRTSAPLPPSLAFDQSLWSLAIRAKARAKVGMLGWQGTL